ncbi:MAG TPA: hypothetical protein VFX96_18440 [Pyrinomonadaceae bacterium]|nr:hypothetical protein [Pyrinomonadaceae bacterium]
MDTFRKGAGRPGDPAGGRPESAPADSSAADLSSVFNYPALGQLFDSTDTRALEEMRARLARTGQDLERVVRQGPKEDAERASRAARAVNVTLEFLNELEKMRREGGAK